MAVRREKVILSVEDHLSSEMLRMAAATKTLDKALDGVDRSNLRTSGGIDRLGSSSSKASAEVDKLSGRLRLFRDIGVTLGPALAPIGAVMVPAVAGLAAQLGAAALAGGTAVVAFQGVGDALKAVNDAALEPTAANLEKAREALREIGPEAQQFVFQMQELRPVFDGLSDAAGAGIFPGLSAAFAQFEEVAPRLEGVLTAIGDATGDLVNDFAIGVSGSRGMEFLEFIRTEVPAALTDLGRTMANFTAGLAEMWMAFTPLNDDFSGWLLRSSEAFDQWASKLAQTEGFEEFIAYIRENGPRVAEALGGIGNALVSIVTAVAPLGGPTLMAIEGVADAIAAIAGSDAGPAIMAAVTAMTLLGRSTQAFGKVTESSWGQAINGSQGAIAQFETMRQTAVRGGAALAGMSLSLISVGENASSAAQTMEGFANIAGGALLGFAVGGPIGAALAGGIALVSELASSNDALVDAIRNADAAIRQMDVEQMEDALSRLNDEYAQQSALVNGLNMGLPGLGDAYDNVLGNTEETKDAQRKLNAALATARGETVGVESATLSLANVADRYVAVAERQAAALRESRQAARSTGASFIDLADNADDAKVSLAQWLRGLERQAEALRDFRINAQEAGEKGLRQGLIKDLQELGPVGALRMRQLANATDSEIRRANQAWQSGQEQIRKYTNEVGGVPTTKTTTINVAAGAALGTIDLVRQQMRYLDGLTSTTYVQTVQRGRVSGGNQQYADGGWTGPGSKYQPAGLVHADEFVFSKEATHGNVAQLEALHNKLRGYADGGYVGERNAPAWRSQQSHSFAFAPAVVDIRMPDGRVQTAELRMREVARDEIAADKNFSGRLNDRD